MHVDPPLTVTIHDDVPPDVDSFIDTQLHDANRIAAPLHEVRPLCCVARIPTGEVVGGVIARTWGRCCEIQQLWVHPNHRRHGIGTRLMRDLHQRAERRGCHTFYLETMSFQAPRFYRSLGYQTRLEITGFTSGITKHYMVRELPHDPTP